MGGWLQRKEMSRYKVENKRNCKQKNFSRSLRGVAGMQGSWLKQILSRKRQKTMVEQWKLMGRTIKMLRK